MSDKPSSAEIHTVRKFIIEQLLGSKYGIDYKYCLDYIRNYKDDQYRQLAVSRTHKDENELLKEASSLVAKVDKWLFYKLKDFTVEHRAEILGNSAKLLKFLESIDEYIKEQSNVFLHRT